MKPTQEQVLQWAKSVGIEVFEDGRFVNLDFWEFKNAITLAYEAGRKDENEACAKVCDEKAEEWYETRGWIDDFAKEIAAVIRARGEQ